MQGGLVNGKRNPRMSRTNKDMKKHSELEMRILEFGQTIYTDPGHDSQRIHHDDETRQNRIGNHVLELYIRELHIRELHIRGLHVGKHQCNMKGGVLGSVGNVWLKRMPWCGETSETCGFNPISQ